MPLARRALRKLRTECASRYSRGATLVSQLFEIVLGKLAPQRCRWLPDMGWNRARYKFQQIQAFWRHTETPAALALDVLRLKRRPFVAASKDGVRLRLEPGMGESFTFFENVVRRDYLAEWITVNPGDTIVDIGANIGTFSVLAARKVGPTGQVISFEPNPEICRRLEENVALNGLDNVTCVPEAIDGSAALIELYITEKSSLSTSKIERQENIPAKRIAVQATTVASCIERFNLSKVNLLKIDCEGSEYGIFETMSGSTASAIDQIALEVHDLPRYTRKWLHDQINSLGFNVREGQYCWFATRR
jgi:FkbM family methyltransferase